MAFLEYIFYIPHFILGVHIYIYIYIYVYIYIGGGGGGEGAGVHTFCAWKAMCT